MQYIRSSIVTLDSNIVEVTTNKLLVGMYIYDGNYLPVGTIIS